MCKSENLNGGIAIANPNSGSGSSFDVNYGAAINRTRSCGMRVVGYVSTSYGQRSMAEVKSDIARYRSWYNLDGFFLDETSSSTTQTSFYAELAQYIRASSSSLIVLNPGTIPAEAYLSYGDIVVIHENYWSSQRSWVGPSWLAGYAPERFCFLYHTTPNATAMRTSVQLTKQRGAAYVYITDDKGSNPWDTLPTFYTEQVQLLKAPTMPKRRGAYLTLWSDSGGSTAYSSNPIFEPMTFILGNATREDLLLGTLYELGFNAISLYDLGSILPGKAGLLRSFIARARGLYGILWVEGIAGSSTSSWKRMADYQNATDSDDAKFDGFLTEIEYWNTGGSVSDIVTPVVYMKSLYPKPRVGTARPYYAAYIGWSSPSDIAVLREALDYLFVHVYVKNPSTAFSCARERVTNILLTTSDIRIVPIFSAEGQAYRHGSEVFMGDWLAANSVSAAESTYTSSFVAAFQWAEAQLSGFQWFSYFAVKMYAPMPYPKHVENALALVGFLRNKSTGVNIYAASPNYVVMDGERSSARTQCATFVTALLQLSYGWTNDTFRNWLSSTSPFASQYHDAIVNGNGFSRVAKVQDIQMGDVIALKYEAGADNTGHAMVALGVTAMEPVPPLAAGTTQWAVRVVDSTDSYHGPADTRTPPSTQGGIGMGTFRIYAVASTGAVVGYAWSSYANAVYYGEAHHRGRAPSERVNKQRHCLNTSHLA